MTLIPEGGIKAPHVLVTIALPTEGQGLDDIPDSIVVGGTAYVRVPTVTEVTKQFLVSGHFEFIGVVTACEVMNDDRPDT